MGTEECFAHGIGIKEFKITERIELNKESVIEFVPDKVGSFHFHCSVICGSGHGKMHGTLIVKE